MKIILTLIFIFFLHGCAIYPMRVVMPFETKVVDATTKEPIENAQYIRIVCDIHNFGCKNAYLDSGKSSPGGIIHLKSKREWGVWIPVPGGLPAPSHQIAIWARGYKVVIFSQYDGDIDEFNRHQKNQEISNLIEQIPKENRMLIDNNTANHVFLNGTLLLERVE